MRLFLGQAARGIAAMAIGAAKHDVLGFVHRLDALVALQTANALGVSFASRLVDPVPWRQSCAHDCRPLNRNRNRRAITGGSGVLPDYISNKRNRERER